MKKIKQNEKIVQYALTCTFGPDEWHELEILKQKYGIAKRPFIRLAVREAIRNFHKRKA